MIQKLYTAVILLLAANILSAQSKPPAKGKYGDGPDSIAPVGIIKNLTDEHRSEANLSEKPRWSLIAVYNRSSNIPYNEPSKSSIVPLQVVPDEALMEWETEGIGAGANFLEKDKDEALK